MLTIGFKTLIYREVKRFLNVYNQTLIAPVVNSLLYFVIFTVIFSGRFNDVNYQSFIASGIIIMAMLQNSYANTQSTITTAKVLGFVVDFIIPPISIKTLLFAILIAGIARGLIVGFISFITLSFFVHFEFHNPFLILIYAVLASALFASFGIMVGSLSKNFDSAISYNTYIIMPITFLSGTFYSIKFLPEFWQKVIQFNPVFYIIDGFRYAVIGISESSISQPVTLLFLFAWFSVFGILAYTIMKKHYHEF